VRNVCPHSYFVHYSNWTSHLVVSFGGKSQKNGIALDKQSDDGELGTNSMSALC